MALPVIADIFRCTFEWTNPGNPVAVNVFHVAAAAMDETEVSAAVIEAVDDNMGACIQEDYGLTTVAVLPLDGTTPTFFESTPGLCQGQSGGDVVPEVAGVLAMKTTRRGPRGRGRVFLGPCGEESISSGLLLGDSLSRPPIAWQTFADTLAGGDVFLSVASYVHADAHVVNAITMSANVGTQRRRLLQTRP